MRSCRAVRAAREGEWAMGEVDELVAGLRSFRTRKESMDRLIDRGQEAVAALLEVLDGRSEGMRWAAMRCLGEIGDERAVGPLLNRLEVSSDRAVACWALARVTGEDLGDDAEAWRRWRKGVVGDVETEAAETAAAELADDALFAEAVRGLTASVQGSGASRIVSMALEDGRHQAVRVAMAAKDMDGEPMVLVYSECAPADPKTHEFALRLNLSLPYAALAIREVEGQKRLVMFNSLLRKGLTPLALRKSVLTIAGKADAVEKRLTGQDEL